MAKQTMLHSYNGMLNHDKKETSYQVMKRHEETKMYTAEWKKPI